MAEFSLIDQFCRGVGPDHSATTLSIGDDAAIIAPEPNTELAISVDTMVAGVHFFDDVSPEHLAHKILAVNLSDMAAMGAEPKWATLALTLPAVDQQWLASFSKGLKNMAERFGVQLVGGDTTQGQLSLSLTIIGLLPKSKSLTRSGAKPHDNVYVTNTLGDAALGLLLLNKSLGLSDESASQLISALEKPEPRVDFGRAILDVASSCLDISDGLVGDLGHICQQSGVSIELDLEKIPRSSAYNEYLDVNGLKHNSLSGLRYALSGGDDYELAFTAPANKEADLYRIAKHCGLSISNIGRVIERTEVAVQVLKNGIVCDLDSLNSFEHFS